MKHRRRLGWGVSVFVAVLGLVACTAPKTQQPLSRVHQPVLLAEKGSSFEYAFAPARSLADVRQAMSSSDEALVVEVWLRELAELGAPNHASGAVLAAALNTMGQEMFLPERPELPLRYSCGVTFVSPSYAVTAAHCVADDTGLPRVQMFRPGPELESAVPQAALLRGSWPDLTHDVLDASSGYFVDEYDCEIALRCDPRWGSLTACPYGTEERDVALLRCEGRPGDTYGYLPIAEQQPTAGTVVYMPWKHEVYDIAQSAADQSELSDHYVERGTIETNLHYFGNNENQLLPLRSIPWADGTERTTAGDGWTDLMGCHGTSGSGLLVRGTLGYQVWGIATTGSPDLNDKLCHNTGERLIVGQGPGSAFLGSNWTEPGVLAASVSELLSEDCALSSASGEARVLGSVLDGQRHALTSWYSQIACQPLAGDVDATGAGFALEASRDPGVALEAMASMSVGPFNVWGDTDYRVGLHGLRDVDCASCTHFEISVGSSVPVAFRPGAGAGVAAPVAFAHSSRATEGVRLTIRNLGDATRFVAPVIVPEGQANAFDTPFDRLEASLFEVTGDHVGPAPMRFVGDGVAGFSAQVRSSERMVLSRQALFAGATYHVRLEASDYARLSCGLIDGAGAVILSVACAPLFTLDTRNVAAGIAGFFVEADASAGVVSIDAVALASDRADDTDGDGVPDVLDACPLDASTDPSALDCDGDTGGAGPVDAGAPLSDGGAPVVVDAGRVADAGKAMSSVDAGTAGAGGEDSEGQGGSPSASAGAAGAGGTPNAMGGFGGNGPASVEDPRVVPEPSVDASAPDSAGRQADPHDGCGCRLGAQRNAGESAGWLALLALLGLRRRNSFRRSLE